MKLESCLEYPIPTELRKAAKKDSSFIARMERYLVSGGAALPLHGKSVSVKACHQDIKRVRFHMWKNNNMIEKSHHAEIMKIRTLGAKAERIREYVEKFAIGIIIFDEIQLLDFSHTRENSFDSLLTLSNRTKVATAVVGTEDAKAKMFKTLRTARRVGNVINGNIA